MKHFTTSSGHTISIHPSTMVTCYASTGQNRVGGHVSTVIRDMIYELEKLRADKAKAERLAHIESNTRHLVDTPSAARRLAEEGLPPEAFDPHRDAPGVCERWSSLLVSYRETIKAWADLFLLAESADQLLRKGLRVPPELQAALADGEYQLTLEINTFDLLENLKRLEVAQCLGCVHSGEIEDPECGGAISVGPQPSERCRQCCSGIPRGLMREGNPDYGLEVPSNSK